MPQRPAHLIKRLLSFSVFLCLVMSGCTFGPRMLERSHNQYNDAVNQVAQEQLLLNLVRLRYNDNLARLDVDSIATQYELDTAVEARPFFAAEAFSSPGTFGTFSRILPFIGAVWSNRPTITMTPLDDPDNIRSFFTPSTLDGIIFLSETSYPISTVFSLFVEYLNRVPNAVEASGPPRGIAPEYQEFQRVVQLLQVLKDRGDIRFVREEKIKELSGPLPGASITAAALVEAAKNGYEYRAKPDKTWVLVKSDRRLGLKVNPEVVQGPEMKELCRLLQLKPGLTSYEVTVGGSQEPFPLKRPPEEAASINIFPRSTVQAIYYLSRGIEVPTGHLAAGVVKPTLFPDGTVFDWQLMMEGLFTVHSLKQHCRPKHAFVAVKYRDTWFYIDDRDNDSKVTFSLIMTMSRVNLLTTGRKGGPALTLPVGR